MKEIWLPIDGYEGFYEVSNYGNVRGVDRIIEQTQGRSGKRYRRLIKGRVLKQSFSGSGYLFVGLSRPGKKSKPSEIHRLVAHAFLGSKSEGQEVCHTDGNRTNNMASNLRWDSRSNNHLDKVRHGTQLVGEKNPAARFTTELVIAIRTSSETCEKLARKYNTSISQISRIKNRKIWRHIA